MPIIRSREGLKTSLSTTSNTTSTTTRTPRTFCSKRKTWLMPGGGVGHHFHNQCEEMFIIFDGQAEFTIDGTSTLRGTVGAPTRMGHSHAIYNPSNQAVEFMNMNVT